MSELVTLNCHKFVKEINLYIEQVQEIPKKVNIKKTMCRPIMVKILETKDNVLNLVESNNFICWGTTILMAIVSQEQERPENKQHL